jgi:flagellar protein FliJ
MKVFRYSLQRLLDAKQSIEEGCRGRLAAAQRELEREQRCLAGLREEEDRVTHAPAAPRAAVSTHDLELASRYVAYVRVQAAACALRIAACEQTVAERREVLAKAARERKSLERLRESEERDWRLRLKRFEQGQLDEAAAAQHLRRRRDAQALIRAA